MGSGIFLIGDDLSLAGFDHYFRPPLDDKQVSIPDIFLIDRKSRTLGILVSFVGGVDLTPTLDEVLAGVVQQVKVDRESHSEWYSGHACSSAPEWRSWEHQVRGYKTHGTFKDDTAASKIFPQIAAQYAIESAGERIKDLVGKIKSEVGSLAKGLGV